MPSDNENPENSVESEGEDAEVSDKEDPEQTPEPVDEVPVTWSDLVSCTPKSSS